MPGGLLAKAQAFTGPREKPGSSAQGIDRRRKRTALARLGGIG
jgi:hypothetical protein